MRLFFLFIFLFFAVNSLSATEYEPWGGRDFEVAIRPSASFQTYRSIAAPHHRLKKHAHDQFYALSARLWAYDFSGEIEGVIAHTRKQDPAFDQIKLTGRYRLWDDVSGDSTFSLVAGISLTQAFKHSMHDFSSFHHGKVEGEFHLSLGKELSYCEEFWLTRAWALAAIGTGDHGSPWLRGNFVWENNEWDAKQWGLFVNTLWGLGGKDIHTVHSFDGYGSYRHQSVDVGGYYRYYFERFGWLTLSLTQRVYARNFPAYATVVSLQLQYDASIAQYAAFIPFKLKWSMDE